MEEINFKEFPAWQRAMDLAVEVHKLTGEISKPEVDDLRNISMEIPAKIARATSDDTEDYFNVARSLTYRVETLLYLNVEMNNFTQEEIATAENLCDEVIKLLDKFLAARSA